MLTLAAFFLIRERESSTSFRSREREFQGTKIPPMELAFMGTKVLGYESSRYLALYFNLRLFFDCKFY